MSRRVVHLTLDHLAALDAPCRDCVFWQLDPVRRARVDLEGDAGEEKRAWLSAVLRDWGSCGRVVLVEGRPVGHVVYAPPALLPSADAFPTSPVSPDAVLLASAYVDPAHAGAGLGRLLVQAMARDLVERGGYRAVEAFGRVDGPGAAGRRGRHCLLPADFLGRVGFGTRRAHGGVPRMRMDLRSALTWRDEVEVALERLRGVVRPAPAPAPSPDARVPGTPRGVPGTEE